MCEDIEGGVEEERERSIKRGRRKRGMGREGGGANRSNEEGGDEVRECTIHGGGGGSSAQRT